MTIDIEGIDKAELLLALYNGARSSSFGGGFGVLRDPKRAMTIEDAREILERGDDSARSFGGRRGLYFDYVWGRPLKVDLTGDILEPGLYDRDNGRGAAAAIVGELRSKAR